MSILVVVCWHDDSAIEKTFFVVGCCVAAVGCALSSAFGDASKSQEQSFDA